MHIEFIDLLRCPEPHEETWLVAAFNRTDGRDIVEAKLGCPICGKEFFIRDGVALFDSSVRPAPARTDTISDEPVRLAAFLDLTAPGKTALLAGESAAAADAVAEISGARVIALNSSGVGPQSDSVAHIRAAERIPLASGSLDGIALDAAHSTSAMIAEAARLLRPRGRLVISAATQPPASFTELARDQNYVVAELPGELLFLRRGN